MTDLTKHLPLMLDFQKREETAYLLYSKIANKEKDENNKKVLQDIANDEKQHALVWEKYTGKKVKPSYIKIYWSLFLNFLLGYTFVLKMLERNEYKDGDDLKALENDIPEVAQIIEMEKKHEEMLINMLDEERLRYVGAMVLGLNDALVELTGTIAGLTFALMQTKLVALAGIITGVAATLSMAASNYLAEKADGNPKALKASFYTGIAYLITVVLLVIPYLVLPADKYIEALAIMIAIVIFIIFFFNFYIAVAKTEPFLSRFIEMTVISLGVAFIAFAIGLIAKHFLAIEI